MMLKPYMNDLLKKVSNRYLLVNVTAKRARDVALECQEEGVEMVKKPVRVALEEIDAGEIIPMTADQVLEENERLRKMQESEENEHHGYFEFSHEVEADNSWSAQHEQSKKGSSAGNETHTGSDE